MPTKSNAVPQKLRRLLSEAERSSGGWSSRRATEWLAVVRDLVANDSLPAVRAELAIVNELLAEEPTGDLVVRNMRRGDLVRSAARRLGYVLFEKVASIEDGQCDVAIITALHKPELDAVLRTLKGQRTVRPPSDPTTYYEGIWSAGDVSLRIVAAAPTEMGMSASGVLASKLILKYRPKLVAMAGIAAGAKRSNQRFGDILIAEHTLDYGSGKLTAKRFEPDPRPIAINPLLLDRVKSWLASDESIAALEQISNRWPGTIPMDKLSAHVGPLGSGAAVLGDETPIRRLRSAWRKLVGIEMEAHAAHLACRDAVHPSCPFICAKAVCDFASKKDDRWQKYAAYTSANFLNVFLCSHWQDLGLK